MNEPDLDRLSERLELVPAIRLALLFGSRHRGRPRPDSDVDIALLRDAPVGQERCLALAEER